MKINKTFKRIFIKTGCMSFFFYLVIMSIATISYYKIQINKHNSQLSIMLDYLALDIKEDILKLYKNYLKMNEDLKQVL